VEKSAGALYNKDFLLLRTHEKRPLNRHTLWSGFVLPTIEAYQVQHLPIVKAYADKIGVVEVINQLVPTEMGIDPGTI
jgi:hypothetical protein